MAQAFEVLENFTCEVTRSQYVKGMTYHIHKGNDALALRVGNWAMEGKVKILSPDELAAAHRARLVGRGRIVPRRQV